MTQPADPGAVEAGVADGLDPANTPIEQLVAPLDPADDILLTINPPVSKAPAASTEDPNP